MTTTLERGAFHGDPEVKDALLKRIRDHERADCVVKGTYGEQANGHYVRCAVGCSVHELTETQRGGPLHDLYPELLGLPVWLAHLEDVIFEGLPEKEAGSWPRRFAAAIPVGADFAGLADRLAVARLTRILDFARDWPGEVRESMTGAIHLVLAALAPDGTEEQRRLAARSAESAARSAESATRSSMSAEWSAESRSAESAEWAAWAAVWAARSASVRSAELAAWSAESATRSAMWAARSASVRSAESAAWAAESTALLAELENLPTNGSRAADTPDSPTKRK